jgi:23S rRNA pseudouridine1911/1915/1917 synthase
MKETKTTKKTVKKITKAKGLVKKVKVVKEEQPKILYEDADILAVNKPAGLLTHSDGIGKIKTLSGWLVKKFPEAKTVGELLTMSDGEETDRSGIVHRLDKETSGVILLAKTQKGFECLKEQFLNREIKKVYHAFVVGTPRHMRGIINSPIGKSATDFRARSAQRSARGKTVEAETQYMVRKSNKINGENYSFVQAMPKTGRTHQIRVHMKVIGHPIAGDEMYGKVKNPLGFKRTALHSFSVEFKNVSGEKIHIEAPYPEDFEKAMDKFAKTV